MNNWSVRYVQGLIQHRWWVMLATLVLFLATAAGLQHFKFAGDYRVFFGKDNPQLAAHDTLERTYTKADNILFVVQPKDGDVFQPRAIAAIKELTEAAWQLPYVFRVDSITNFQNTWADGDDLTVRQLGWRDMEDTTPEVLAEMRDIALNDPVLAGKIVAKDARTTAILATANLPDNPTLAAMGAVQTARQIIADTKAKYPELIIHLTGTLALNTAFTEAAANDASTLYPIMFALLALTAGFFLRSALGAMATMIVVVVSAISGLGIAFWLGITFSPPTTSSVVIILTIAVADSIHILVSMFHQMREGADRRTAIVESLRINMQPVFLTSLTTAIGFFSLNFADAPPIQALGNIAAIGAIMAWVYSVFFLPAFLSFLPFKPSSVGGRDREILLNMLDVVIRHRYAVLGFWFVVIVGLVALATPRTIDNPNLVNDRFTEFFSHNIDFRHASDFAAEHLTGIYMVEYSIGADGPSGISDPVYLENLEKFANWIRAYPGVDHVQMFTDVTKRLNKSMHGDDPGYYRIPEEREMAAQYILLYEMSLPYGMDLNNQLNVDKSATRVTVTMGSVSSGQIRQFARDGVAWLDTNLPDYMQSPASGVALMFSFMTERNVLMMINGTGVALLLISITILIALRNLRLGMLSLIPNILPPVVVFAAWILTVGQLGMYAAFVTSAALGMIVDFTVHFLSKYQRARREKALDAFEGVHYAMSTVGSALWVTAFVLLAGFSVLAFSDFLINANQGKMTAMIIATALAADFTLLPALLVVLDRGGKNKTTDERIQDASATPA